jgi:hypothetical protein
LTERDTRPPRIAKSGIAMNMIRVIPEKGIIVRNGAKDADSSLRGRDRVF